VGTLSVTTTTGSNGTTDNTLVNGLLTTFDGRASKSTISTQVVPPVTLPQAGGRMFGPDQDNYIKLVAIVRVEAPQLVFYSENKEGTTIGPIRPFLAPLFYSPGAEVH